MREEKRGVGLFIQFLRLGEKEKEKGRVREKNGEGRVKTVVKGS